MDRDFEEYMDTLGFPANYSWGKASFAKAILPKELPAVHPKVFFVACQLSFNSNEAGALLLKKMIAAMGLAFEDVLVIELPVEVDEEEREAFLSKVREQQPLVIICQGESAAKQFISMDKDIEAYRGRFHEFPVAEVAKAPAIMVTYHPDALVAQPALKKAAWDDLQAVMAVL